MCERMMGKKGTHAARFWTRAHKQLALAHAHTHMHTQVQGTQRDSRQYGKDAIHTQHDLANAQTWGICAPMSHTRLQIPIHSVQSRMTVTHKHLWPQKPHTNTPQVKNTSLHSFRVSFQLHNDTQAFLNKHTATPIQSSPGVQARVQKLTRATHIFLDLTTSSCT